MTNDELDALEAALRARGTDHGAELAADAIRELRAELAQAVQTVRELGAVQATINAERDSLRAALDNCNHLRSALENSVEPMRASLAAVEKAGEALAKAARSLAGDVGTHHEAWIWDKLDEWDAALAARGEK